MTDFVSLEEAVASVGEGDHLALAGFAITRNAVAAAHALIRAGVSRLSLSQVVGGIETDLLVGAGCVDHLTFSAGSLDRFGTLQALNRRLGQGLVTYREYSSLALTSRFLAAALGVPFMPSRSMLGSDLIAPLVSSGEIQVDTDPFTGETVALVAPLRPDTAILHADRVDEAGNVFVGGPTWTMREVAYAARRLVVVCEEVVPVGKLDPASVLLPGMLVDAVALVPHAAHPTAVYQRYDYDAEHLRAYVAAGRDVEGFEEYLRNYVLGCDSHEEYLAKCGVKV